MYDTMALTRESHLRVGQDETVFDGQFIQVIRRPFTDARSGQQGIWEMVRRKTHGNIVAVVPVTPDKEVVLAKIFRVPLKAWTIEFCAGLMDKPGMTEIELARQEMRQKLGYEADTFQLTMSGPFNGGMTDDRLHIYLACGARRVGKPELEAAEDIQVIRVPVKKLYNLLIHPPRGCLVDVKTFGILPFLEPPIGGIAYQLG